MKVKDIIPKKNKVEKEFQNLQLLEKFLENNHEYVEDLGEKANCNMSVLLLIREARIACFDLLNTINKKIENAEIVE